MCFAPFFPLINSRALWFLAPTGFHWLPLLQSRPAWAVWCRLRQRWPLQIMEVLHGWMVYLVENPIARLWNGWFGGSLISGNPRRRQRRTPGLSLNDDDFHGKKVKVQRASNFRPPQSGPPLKFGSQTRHHSERTRNLIASGMFFHAVENHQVNDHVSHLQSSAALTALRTALTLGVPATPSVPHEWRHASASPNLVAGGAGVSLMEYDYIPYSKARR